MRQDAAQYITIKQLFKENELLIPSFQRQYEWDESNLDNLWDSITSSENHNLYQKKEYYFIGSLISYEEMLNGEEKASIVDGQQRTLTLHLLLLAYKNVLNDEKAKFNNWENEFLKENLALKQVDIQHYVDLFNSLQQGLSITTQSSAYVLLNNDKVHYQSIIDKNEETFKDETIVKNYKWLYTNLKNLLNSDITNFIDTLEFVLERVLFLHVQLKSFEEATDIFVSLNTNRKSLTISDLLKTLFIKEANSIDNLSIDEINEQYIHIKDKVIKEDKLMVDFIRIYWFGKIKEKVSEEELYKSISQHLRMNKIELKEIFYDLKKYSTTYKNMEDKSFKKLNHDKNTTIDLINNTLNFLKEFKFKQLNATLLKVLYMFENDKLSTTQIQTLLNLFSTFAYVYTKINKEKPQTIENITKKIIKLDFEDFDKDYEKLKSLCEININRTIDNIKIGNWANNNSHTQYEWKAMYVWYNNLVNETNYSQINIVKSVFPLYNHTKSYQELNENEQFMLSTIQNENSNVILKQLEKDSTITLEDRVELVNSLTSKNYETLEYYKTRNNEILKEIEEKLKNL